MNLSHAIATITGCAIAFAAIGTTCGYMLGRYFPGYYRSIAVRGESPFFSPISFGVGQGLTQGLTAGIIIGLILVVLFLWQEKRLTPKA